MSVPTISQLQDPAQFELVMRISHSDVAREIRPHLVRRSLVTTAYWLLNFAVLGYLISVWRVSGLSFISGFPLVSIGMVVGYLILMPIHEAIHALAYRMIGASSVRITYDWRRITAQCVADRKVVGRGAFSMVCLLPLIVLNSLLVLTAIMLHDGAAKLIAVAVLLLHTGAVSGDVALVNLLWSQRSRPNVWTYDDIRERETYFYTGL